MPDGKTIEGGTPISDDGYERALQGLRLLGEMAGLLAQAFREAAQGLLDFAATLRRLREGRTGKGGAGHG